MDIGQAYQWLESHWLVISLVWLPAFFGYLNAFAASFKVMGWTKLADFCGKLENAAKAFVDAKKQEVVLKQTDTSTDKPTKEGE